MDGSTSLPRDSVRRNAHEPPRPSHSGTPTLLAITSSTSWSRVNMSAVVVVDGIQLRIPSVKRTICKRTENSSQLLLSDSPKSHLLRTDDMLARLSPCRRDEAPLCVLGVGLPYTIGVGHQVKQVEIHHLHTRCRSGATSHGGVGHCLPNRSQLDEVSLTLNSTSTRLCAERIRGTCLATCILSSSRDTNVATRQVGTRLALSKRIVGSVPSRPKAPNASTNMPHSDKK